MYQEHPICELPPDDATLWRYMNFTKFVSLLEKQALFFARARYLDDPFEGSLPKRNLVQLDKHVNNLDWPEDQKKVASVVAKAGYMMAKNFYMLVNCWHESHSESDFMWKLYAREKGIAVMTSFDSLKRSFTCKTPVHIGRVQYVDYNRDLIPPDDPPRSAFFSIDMLRPLLHKRESFAPEREVRAIAVPSVADRPGGDIGDFFEVDLSILIERVFVAPYVGDGFKECVEAVAKRYGLKASVCRSALADGPTWW